MYTLVMVDMQPGFEAANDKRTIKNCIKYIKRAKRDMATIIVMEYGYDEECSKFGKTHEEIRKHLENYKWQLRIVKERDDGSMFLLNNKKFQEMDCERHDVRFCGVNTTACVARTIQGMIDRLEIRNPKVLLDACNQPSGIYGFSKSYTRCMMESLTSNGVILEKPEYSPV